jgi:hypothetical protein
MAFPIIGAALAVGGLLGGLTQKTPRYNMGAMNEVQRLIEKQYGDVENYFKEANSAFETQYGQYYGNQMGDIVNQLAGQGIYDSPVSERALGRQRQALGDTYATAKSQLAGERMSALGSIDQQKINYLQNLAGIQYQRQLAKQQKNSSEFGGLAGLGAALTGI